MLVFFIISEFLQFKPIPNVGTQSNSPAMDIRIVGKKLGKDQDIETWNHAHFCRKCLKEHYITGQAITGLNVKSN